MNLVKWLMAAAAASMACGSPAPGDVGDTDEYTLDTEGGIAILEQPYVSQLQSGAGTKVISGIVNGASLSNGPASRCNSNTAGQNCVVPQSKTVIVDVLLSTCTSTERAAIISRISEQGALYNTLLNANGWTVANKTGSATANVVLACSHFASIGQPDFVVDYLKYNFHATTAVFLTESIPGQVVKETPYDFSIAGDRWSALSAAKQRQVIDTAINYALGAGSSSGTGNFVSNPFLDGLSGKGLLNSGELCRVRNYSLTGSNSFSTSSSAGCNNS